MIIQQFVPHVVGRMVEIDVVDDDQSLPASRIKDHWVSPNEDRWDLIREALSLGVLPVSALSEVAYCMVKHVPAVRSFLHAAIRRCSSTNIRLWTCPAHAVQRTRQYRNSRRGLGDMDQAIFAYDGRSSVFLNELIADPHFKTFEITENHRCHRSIVDYSLSF